MIFCFQSVAIYILIEVYKAGLTQIRSWKREDIVITFSDNCGHSSMIRHQILISFLKVGYNLESETKSMNFYSVTSKLIGLSSTLNDFCYITCTDHLENTVSIRYADPPHVDTFQYVVSKSHILIRKNHQSHQKSL